MPLHLPLTLSLPVPALEPQQCEDLDDLSSLGHIFRIVRAAIMLNESTLLEELLKVPGVAPEGEASVGHGGSEHGKRQDGQVQLGAGAFSSSLSSFLAVSTRKSSSRVWHAASHATSTMWGEGGSCQTIKTRKQKQTPVCPSVRPCRRSLSWT